MMQIPFNRPYLTGNESRYMDDVLHSLSEGGHISGDGKYTKLVQAFFQSKFGARKALMTTSCTSALEMATRLLDLKPGDEVIVPSYTFSSTVNPVLLCRCKTGICGYPGRYPEHCSLTISVRKLLRKPVPFTRFIMEGFLCDG